jgi:GNAT superfamily N-acetyltransferase
MQIQEVKTRNDKNEFINFPKRLYEGDPNWVCMLDNELEATFDRDKNHLYGQGDACRWILKDSNGTTIGRIAAFYDRVRSSANRQPTGGIGFFEVIEDREAAFILFDTGKEWLKANGMEAMDGPVNFGENDTNWGLLVEGFVQQGFGMPYHKKYYRDFFESYGFKNYFEQYSYHREVFNEKGEIDFPPRILKIADWISKRPGYSFEHFEFARKEKFVNDLVDIYNSTWSVFKDDFTPLNPTLLDDTLEKAKAFIDEDLIWFAYHNNKPIAFFVIFPDLNQIIKPFKGKLNILNMIRFVYAKWTHKMTRMRAIVGGVDPSYQNKGVESAIFYKVYQICQHKYWYKELELSWVGDFNPKMIAIYEALGAKMAKKHITFRYLINDKLEFIRYKDEMAEKEKKPDPTKD